jgi:hypothetical protein
MNKLTAGTKFTGKVQALIFGVMNIIILAYKLFKIGQSMRKQPDTKKPQEDRNW